MEERVALIGAGSPLLALGLSLVRKDADLTGIWAQQRARAQKSTLALGCPAFAEAIDALREASIAISDLPFEELRSYASGASFIAAALTNVPQERDFLGNEAEISLLSDTLPDSSLSCLTTGFASEKKTMSDSCEDIMSDAPFAADTWSLQSISPDADMPVSGLPMSEVLPDKAVYEDIFSDGPDGYWENSGRLALRLILDGAAPERVWGALRLRGSLGAVGRLSRLFAALGFEVHADV